MNTWILSHEPLLRLCFFLGIFFIMANLELIVPRRQPQNNTLGIKRLNRWFNNLSLITLSSLIAKIVLPIGLASFAIYCQQSEWGLFNQDIISSNISYAALFIFSLLIFDFIIYWQHRIFHKVQWLWRLHQVHHSDTAFDVTTGIRFHPIEILLSIAIKFAVVLIFGFSAESIIVFEILLNALALFNHSNVQIPLTIDKQVRKIIVTPDMHRVHHSTIPKEHNSNFGFNISLWDRLFSSYQDQPELGHKNIEIGLNAFTDSDKPNRLIQLLLMPFKPPNN